MKQDQTLGVRKANKFFSIERKELQRAKDILPNT